MSRHRVRTRGLVALALLLATGAGSACLSERSAGAQLTGVICQAPSTAAGATVVFVRSFVFDPPSVRVKAGGSVVWVNCEPGGIPHTSTSSGALWESGTLAPGGAFVRVFPTAGTFEYLCALHPSMTGTVIVD